MTIVLATCLILAPHGICNAEIDFVPNIQEISIGFASQYAPGVMQRTIRVRQRIGHIPADVSGYDGYVAYNDQAHMGETVFIRPIGYPKWEKFLVVDCCSYAGGSCNWMHRNNILVEVDHETILRWSKFLNRSYINRGVRILLREVQNGQ